ncbi:MAG: hypothetical protein FAF05_01030 [Epsilonproteobacteria bacterium]|nr:hypothetical protein [Campylobacterota bacterium]
MDAASITADRYLDTFEIQEHLKNVEYIVMATPAPEKYIQTPLHFTLFLNTADNLPKEIQEAILEKFCADHNITNPQEVLSQLMPVGFAISKAQDTPMPMLLIKQQDRAAIPNVPMHVIDFLGDSDQFYEAKVKNLTGWSYIYEQDRA